MALHKEKIPIVGGSSFARYPNISASASYNMVVSGNALVSFFGHEKKLDLGITAGGRALFRSTRFNNFIAVFDKDVYVIDENLVAIKVGALNELGTNVFISENNNREIAIVNGTSTLYIFNYGTNDFSTVALVFNAAHITFMDGYLIAVDSLTNEWYLSALNNASSWDPNDRTSIQIKGDLCIGVQRLERQLFVFGAKSTVVYNNVGAAIFPFAVNNSISIDYGCLSAESIANSFGLLVWLGGNEKSGATIMASTGGAPYSLSENSAGLDFLLARLGTPQDCSGALIKQDGHIYYILTFKTDNLSIVYDVKNHIFSNFTDHDYNHFIGRRYEFFDNKHYFIPYDKAEVHQFGTDFFNYDGKAIPRIRILDSYRAADSSLFIGQSVRLQMQTNNSAEIQKVEYLISKNSGRSFGSATSINIGGLSSKNKLVTFWNMGRTDDLVQMFRFWGTNSRFVVTDGAATLDVEKVH